MMRGALLALVACAASSPPKALQKRTAIVITVHNALNEARACLEAVGATTTPATSRLVVVLDSCDALTAAAMETLVKGRDGMIVVTDFSSYSLAANAGIAAALAEPDVDSVALLNSDAVPSAGWLSAMRRVLFAGPPGADALYDAFESADADGDGALTASELARRVSRPNETAFFARALQPLDADGDARLTWAEVCGAAPPTAPRGCDGRDFACASLADAASRDRLEAAGLRFPTLGGVGALSNAATHQTVPWPTRRRVRGWNVVELPEKWSHETMARAARLAAPDRPADAGLLNGFLMLLSRRALETVGPLDVETYPGGYGEENDWAVRCRRAGLGLAVALDVHVFHAKTASYGVEAREHLKAIARRNSRRKWPNGEITLAESLLKRSPLLARARALARAQYAGYGAKILGAAPASALVLAEATATAPAFLSGALVRSCAAADAGACDAPLAAPVFDYIVTSGPAGFALAENHTRCHPRVVHVDQQAA